MKIWVLVIDNENYENMQASDDKSFHFAHKNFRRGRIIEDIPDDIRIKTGWKGRKAKKGELADIGNLGNLPILFGRAKELLEDVLGENVQYIKFMHETRGECYAVNVTKVVDCADRKKMDLNPSHTVYDFYFKKDIEYPPIFKVKDYIYEKTFVTEEFVKVVKRHKITGLAMESFRNDSYYKVHLV